MFGFKFNENFNYPYVSKSITEFWHRWHISLSTWFRDYVYIPLGGSRCSKARSFFNMFVVWLLTGVWHGASWNFVVWGLYYFIFLVIEKSLLGDKIKEIDKFTTWKKVILHFYTLIIVLFGWVIFRAESLTEAFQYIEKMFGVFDIQFVDIYFVSFIKSKLVYFVFGLIFAAPVYKYIEKVLNKHKYASVALSSVVMITLFIITISYLVKGTYNPFIYFNF